MVRIEEFKTDDYGCDYFDNIISRKTQSSSKISQLIKQIQPSPELEEEIQQKMGLQRSPVKSPEPSAPGSILRKHESDHEQQALFKTASKTLVKAAVDHLIERIENQELDEEITPATMRSIALNALGRASFTLLSEQNLDEIVVGDHSMNDFKSYATFALSQAMESSKYKEDVKKKDPYKKYIEEAKKYNMTLEQFDVSLYFNRFKVNQLLRFMMEHLLMAMPDHPITFLRSLLDDCLLFRANCVTKIPTMFSDKHLEALFHSFDPLLTNHISLKQYQTAMKVIGMTSYKENPELTPEGVTKEEFLTNAKTAVSNHLREMFVDPFSMTDFLKEEMGVPDMAELSAEEICEEEVVEEETAKTEASEAEEEVSSEITSKAEESIVGEAEEAMAEELAEEKSEPLLITVHRMIKFRETLAATMQWDPRAQWPWLAKVPGSITSSQESEVARLKKQQEENPTG